MIYDVLWHDAEDDVSGTSFQVEGRSLLEAYFKAEKSIVGTSEILARRFCPGDIEVLVDELGESHYPWDFYRKASDEEIKLARERVYDRTEENKKS